MAIDFDSNLPIYIQVMDYIKKEIMNELTLSVDSSTFGVHIKVSLFFLKEKMPYF